MGMDSEDMGKTCVGTTLFEILGSEEEAEKGGSVGRVMGVGAAGGTAASPSLDLDQPFQWSPAVSPHGWVPVPTFHCNPRVGTLGEITPSVH